MSPSKVPFNGKKVYKEGVHRVRMLTILTISYFLFYSEKQWPVSVCGHQHRADAGRRHCRGRAQRPKQRDRLRDRGAPHQPRG